MNLLQALLLGLIQGLTEFVPVSSTAHLLVGQKVLGVPSGDATFSFLVLVQLGTTLTLIVYFRQELLALLRAFFARPFSTPQNKLAWYILIATLPALLAGVLLKDLVEELFKEPLQEAGIRLLTAAVLMAVAEYFGKRIRQLENMTWLDALFIGLMQVIAIFPGASRSGTTISGGMLRGFDRPSAARFAFLMSVPVLLAASAYQTVDMLKTVPDLGSFLPSMAVGFITAAVVGWFAIKWLLTYLSWNSLYAFVIYCVVAGVTCLIFVAV